MDKDKILNSEIDGESEIDDKSKPICKKTKNEIVEEAKSQQAKLEKITIINRELKKINNLLRHIDRVKNAAQILADRLIEQDEIYLARRLIAKSLCHDYSKFLGIEWDYLVKSDGQEEVSGDNLKLAIYHHTSSNDHHPEYWGCNINNMSQESMAEMVCDLHARASEAGTDLRSYIKDVFCKKHNISHSGKGYKSMKRFIDLLLDTPLKPIQLNN